MNVILDMSLIVVFIAFLLYCNATRQITFNISKGSTVKTDICGLATNYAFSSCKPGSLWVGNYHIISKICMYVQ